MFEEIIREIGKHNRIIIHRHSKPDGDAIGSQAGLKYLIEENFPGKEVYAVGDAAGRYAFMDGSTPDVIPDGYYADALAIVLDTSAGSARYRFTICRCLPASANILTVTARRA